MAENGKDFLILSMCDLCDIRIIFMDENQKVREKLGGFIKMY